MNINKASDRLTKVQNGVSSNSYYYDARGNTTNEIQHIDAKNYSLTYTYDKTDHFTNITYPSQVRVSYSYTNGQIRTNRKFDNQVNKPNSEKDYKMLKVNQ